MIILCCFTDTMNMCTKYTAEVVPLHMYSVWLKSVQMQPHVQEVYFICRLFYTFVYELEHTLTLAICISILQMFFHILYHFDPISEHINS